MTEETIDIEIGKVVEKVDIMDGTKVLGILHIHIKDGNSFVGRLIIPEFTPDKGFLFVGNPPFLDTDKVKQSAVNFMYSKGLVKEETKH